MKQKRFIGFMLAVMFMASLFVGCPGITITEDEEARNIKLFSVAGRRISYHLLGAAPALAPECEKLVDEALATVGDPAVPLDKAALKVVIGMFANRLGDYINDPLLADDVSDMMDLLEFGDDETVIPPVYQGYVLAFSEGFKMGIERWKVTTATNP